VSPGPLIVDQMMSRGSLELWRKHDDVMKRIYCHYATLDFLSADKVSWKGVRERNSTMSLSELTLQMINFAVNPGLLTKNQLRDIMHAVDAENDADGARPRRHQSPPLPLLCRRVPPAACCCVAMRVSRLHHLSSCSSAAPRQLAGRCRLQERRRTSLDPIPLGFEYTHTHTHTHTHTPKGGSVRPWVPMDPSIARSVSYRRDRHYELVSGQECPELTGHSISRLLQLWEPARSLPSP
jgi:hypothetical protein